MPTLLDLLNPSQRDAVTYNDGPQLVIAGAGSGKTRVLTFKIAWLLQQGIPANHILALTFTNKAAREMKERIGKLVGEETARYLWMGTFHSICARILRHEAEHLGFTRDFSIYDTSDSKAAAKQILKEMQLDEKIYKLGNVLSKISAAKNAFMSPSDYAANNDLQKRDRFDRMYDMAEVYRRYELRLQAANAMDFDDLLLNTCRLLRDNAEAAAYYQDLFQYVLVDEYQDTNYVQYCLVKRLAEPQNHICVVGDDAQSIYSFRGADIRNILHFQREYHNARLFKLERNYRSTQTIVNAANSLIRHNENQIHKDVYSEKEVGDTLSLRAYASDRAEAEGIASLISEEHRLRKTGYNEIAVLYRTNAQSRVLENELRSRNIPYRIYGGTSFYQRKEIKDAISYFRLAANPKDTEALMRVINFPARGIGDTTLKKVSECATTHGISMMEVINQPDENALTVNASTLTKLRNFATIIQHFQEAIDTTDAYEFAERVLRESGIMTAAFLDQSQEGIDRKENLDELLSAIHEFVDGRMQEGVSFTPITDFLSEVSLLTDQDEHTEDHTERVTLMTVHAAKGLEFESVFIAGMEENLFPSQYCVRPTEIEEERRLLYVAITRAMVRCYISFAKSRFKNGSLDFSSPSRFLNDLDRQYIKQYEASSQPSFRSAPSQQWGFAAPPRMPRFTPLDTLTQSHIQAEQAKANPVRNASTEMPTDSQFAANERVRHKVFGEGTILRVWHDESNGNDKIEIRFDKVGNKTLLLTFAKLEKI
ncbi:MAG: UvrD-helicase domain-containing protein [Paludibacteraceae bacterium]|nr:UvrD-helicase domain-containing protein [Paludibacteraceae bacterium]